MAGIVQVRDVMSKEVVATMNKFNIGCIIVVQSDRPVGIITERDILKRIVEPCLAPETLRAREVMSSPVITIRDTVSIDEAAKIMARKRLKKLLVMEENKLAGILTFTDIVTQVPNMLGILEELVRPQHRSY
jgi:CBS domain-containing protein